MNALVVISPGGYPALIAEEDLRELVERANTSIAFSDWTQFASVPPEEAPLLLVIESGKAAPIEYTFPLPLPPEGYHLKRARTLAPGVTARLYERGYDVTEVMGVLEGFDAGIITGEIVDSDYRLEVWRLTNGWTISLFKDARGYHGVESITAPERLKRSRASAEWMTPSWGPVRRWLPEVMAFKPADS